MSVGIFGLLWTDGWNDTWAKLGVANTSAVMTSASAAQNELDLERKKLRHEVERMEPQLEGELVIAGTCQNDLVAA